MAKKAIKKAAVSGSEKVRQFYAANPTAKQSEIAKATGVNPSQVSSVLAKLNGKTKKKKAAKRKVAASNGHGNFSSVLALFNSAKEIGFDRAIELLQSAKSN